MDKIAENLGSNVDLSKLSIGEMGTLYLYTNPRSYIDVTGQAGMSNILTSYDSGITIIRFKKTTPLSLKITASPDISQIIVGWQLFKDTISPWIWAGIGLLGYIMLKGTKNAKA